jgi:hypothetical protein
LPPFIILIASVPAGAKAKWLADVALEAQVQTEPELLNVTVEIPILSIVKVGEEAAT